jgi:hypothetical protein
MEHISMASIRASASSFSTAGLALSALFAIWLTPPYWTRDAAAAPPPLTIQGKVEALNGVGMQNYTVSLFASYAGKNTDWRKLGTAKTGDGGSFQIPYSVPPGPSDDVLLFLYAEKGHAGLAAAIGRAAPASAASNQVGSFVVNERTTVAAGNAFAQFIRRDRIEGNTYGMINAMEMAANLADPYSGNVGEILARSPNGRETSTLAAFNALTNVVASCVIQTVNCKTLADATTPSGGTPPTNILQALANIVKYPSYPGYPNNASDPVFQLSQVSPIYAPALSARPTSWLLFRPPPKYGEPGTISPHG